MGLYLSQGQAHEAVRGQVSSFLQGYTTVNGVRMRPIALVQDLLFGTSLAANPR